MTKINFIVDAEKVATSAIHATIAPGDKVLIEQGMIVSVQPGARAEPPKPAVPMLAPPDRNRSKAGISQEREELVAAYLLDKPAGETTEGICNGLGIAGHDRARRAMLGRLVRLAMQNRGTVERNPEDRDRAMPRYRLTRKYLREHGHQASAGQPSVAAGWVMPPTRESPPGGRKTGPGGPSGSDRDSRY